MPEICTGVEARAAGLKRYFTGKPCINGHVAERYVSDWICVACKDMREHAWRKEHRAYIVKRVSDWRTDNLEKAHATRRAWYAVNKAEIAEYFRKYNKLNPENARVQKHARRARMRNAEGRYTKEDVRMLLAVQKGRCAHSWCRKSLKAAYHVDHIKALSRGGTNWPGNLQALCPSCNMSKGVRDPIDFAQRNGALL
jgi:5-methylcytosine-specific restriction endonuclease McrA